MGIPVAATMDIYMNVTLVSLTRKMRN